MVRLPVALVIAGTRPEIIKLAPVIHAFTRSGCAHPLLGLTGQHRELVRPLLELFHLAPAFDLDLMRPDQSPPAILAAALDALVPAVARLKPAVIVVQGDTVSALAGALAGFYAGVPVAHVEAGLRAPEPGAPHPEEGQRQLIGRVARWHFAPTRRAADALRAEGVPAGQVMVTGNSGIDALLGMARRLDGSPELARRAAAALPRLAQGRPLVVATIHRRENRGPRLRAICAGLRAIAAAEAAQLVVTVHPSPVVAATLRSELDGEPRVALIDPPAYPAFVQLLRRARLAISDSGGLQEEAPALGLPLLVLRDTTERPEAIEAGVAALVGADPWKIAGAARAILRDPRVAAWMGRRLDLYGDGRAAARIVATLGDALGGTPESSARGPTLCARPTPAAA
jgi:UDP-N-acetylglucosamine 2-epimerase (non-hydrolysing)